jgi:hypothetical protein
MLALADSTWYWGSTIIRRHNGSSWTVRGRRGRRALERLHARPCQIGVCLVNVVEKVAPERVPYALSLSYHLVSMN